MLRVLLKLQILCRHSGESRNLEYNQYDIFPGCRIKSGMTKTLESEVTLRTHD